jgi:translation initiation factor IF-2
MPKVEKKKIATLATEYEVPNELLIKLLKDKGIEVRSHLTMIGSEEFQAIKDSLLEEKEKLGSRKKGIVRKKPTKSLTKSSDSSSAIGPLGGKVILKKAVLKKAEHESSTDTSAIPKTELVLDKSELVLEPIQTTPVEVKSQVSVSDESISQLSDIPESKGAIIPPISSTDEQKSEPEPSTIEPQVSQPSESQQISSPDQKLGGAVVETTPVVQKASQFKAQVEAPTAEMASRIEKYKQAGGARKPGGRPGGSAGQGGSGGSGGSGGQGGPGGQGPGYTGKFGKAPTIKPGAQRPKPGATTDNRGATSGHSSSNNSFGGSFDPRSSANSPFPPSDNTNAKGPGRGNPAANKKKGKKSKIEKKKEQLDQVKENINRVMASLSKTPGKKVYKKDILGDGENIEKKVLHVSDFITIGELAGMMEVMPAQVIGKCMEMGMMATINHRIDFETITVLADEFGYDAKLLEEYEEMVVSGAELENSEEDMLPRSPIVTVMGHVDHGKTSVLDWIRKENVVAGESGGITQHIGAYEVITPYGNVTFLDTPGHEAFSAMRARGSQVTDVVVLVVAADSMVMPQTVESIEHAKTAKVPIVVAINKCDLPNANPDKIRAQLSERGVEVEQWGGKVSCLEISAKTGMGMDRLLETLALETDVLELRANPNSRAKGTVIESRLDRGKGSVATVLVQNGTLKVGDSFVCGIQSGRVRAMLDERGNPKEFSPPSSACQVLGFDGTPQAGDDLIVFPDDKTAREIAGKRRMAAKERELRFRKHMSLEHMYDKVKSGEFVELNLIIKADVDGSAEAIASSLDKLSNREVKINIVRKGVGAITEADVTLAAASESVIIAFHLLPNQLVRELAETEGVEIRTYRIIYEIIEEIQGLAEGMLKPSIKEEFLGEAEVLELFKIPKVGFIAGSIVRAGIVDRDAQLRIYRSGVEVGMAQVHSLKRFKEDVKLVKTGTECGIGLKGFAGIQVGDTLAFFKEVEVSRKLSDVEA